MELFVSCTFKDVVWGEQTHYTCYMSFYPPIVKANTRIGVLKGVHKAGKSNKDVTAISLTKTFVEFVPRGLNVHFENVEILEIDEGGLRKLSPRDLIGLEGLKEIYLTSNCLTSLPDNLLRNLRKLEKISFAFNKLEFLSADIFASIPENQLTFVDLRNKKTMLDALFDASDPKSLTFKQLTKMISEKFKNPSESFFQSVREKRSFSDNFTANLLKSFRELWTSKRMSDFTIVVGEIEFPVHKNVLGIQSSFFSAMFESEVEETRTGQMTIEDFSAEAVEEFLRHFYTGEIPNVTNTMELFALSSKYNLPALMSVCEELILENIDELNAIDVLNLGNLFNSSDMKALAYNEIQRIRPGLKLTNEFMNKPEELMDLLGFKNCAIETEEPSTKRRKIEFQNIL